MDSASIPKNVCVIGAGMSGLAAARELRREGLAVTAMEQRGDVGGQWLYDPTTDAGDPLGISSAPVTKVHSSMYASVRLISPRECMGFSDFQYLKDFCAAFGLEDAVKLNTKVLRVAMAPPPSSEATGGGTPVGYYSDVKWQVRYVRVEQDGDEGVAVEEVFDAVVIANGHYSQPRLPRIKGGGGGRLRGERPGHSDGALRRGQWGPSHGQVHGGRHDAVTMAPWLSFVGVPMAVFAPWFFEAQARWIALVLSGRKTLPSPEEMVRAVEEDYRAREMAGVPTKHTHFIPAVEPIEAWEFVYRHSDLPRMEDWKVELFVTSFVKNKEEDREAFRDRDDDSESVREGLRRWRRVAGAQYEAALAAASGDHADDADVASSVHNKPAIIAGSMQIPKSERSSGSPTERK
ncbi:hypothetical protein HU200_015387 [Digitaria exilis]|uniref:Flavin-containing monooxygenase n=1 Tax=Digitaria exilis TaxID=1010633 RepID=A0A835FAF4_9POAL|nr:hypothetical protein HU200_015387 [Digitaria exilis]